jgi:hypothetical protein
MPISRLPTPAKEPRRQVGMQNSRVHLLRKEQDDKPDSAYLERRPLA